MAKLPNTVSNSPTAEESILTNLFTFKELIQIPIKAVVDANIAASVAAKDFIVNFGFEKNSENDDDLGKLKMVSFIYNYINEGIPQKMTVSIPILSLVPLPFLTINKADFDLGIQIINQVYDSTKKNKDDSSTKNIEVLALLAPINSSKTQLNTKERYASKLKTNMKAKIEVVSSDLPQGIIKLINLFQDATEGVKDYIYKLSASSSKLYFNKNTPTNKLKIELRKDNEAIEGQLIKVQVKSSIDIEAYTSFDKDIEILEGDIVGYTSVSEVNVLTSSHGCIEIQLFSNPNTHDNGFIKVSSARTIPLSVYYSINQQDPA